MSLSLYRKYRPNVFSDVVGQEHVENTLVNAVCDGSVAHAYLFCGPRGTGKTTTARLLAKALNCEQGACQQPCGTCGQCEAIAAGTHPDVYELDAASRTGVENVREEIISRVHFAPTQGRMKVYIIDEVHMLSTGAFNALLKTLEEPPSHVVFVLCTTEARKVPETIQSRCQRFDFRRFTINEIVGYLQRICDGEGFTYEREALEYLAAKSAGGMRDATTALEQVASFSDGAVNMERIGALFGQLDGQGLFELAGHIAAHDTAACFLWLDRLVTSGADLSQLAADLAQHLRNLYAVSICGPASGIVAAGEAQLEQYRQQAEAFGGPQRLARALQLCGELVAELRRSTDLRLSIEIALTRLCRPESELSLEALAERVAALEAGAATRPAGGPQPAAGAAAPGAAAPAAEPSWEAVPPKQPAWKQQAREQAAHGKRPASNPGGVPLQEAVRREAEREEAQAYRRELQAEGAGAQPQPAEAPEPAAVAAPQPAQAAEPQPAAAPAPQPSPASGMSPARLLAALLTVVKREDMATGALLSGVQLEGGSGGRYTLVFPDGAAFQMRLASSGDAAKLIGRAFEEVLGQPATFTCRLGGTGAARPATPGAAAPQQAPGHPAATPQAAAPAPTAQPAPPAPEPGPVYDDGYDYGTYSEDDGGGQQAAPPPASDGAAADVADALAVFGEGVTVQEIDE